MTRIWRSQSAGDFVQSISTGSGKHVLLIITVPPLWKGTQFGVIATEITQDFEEVGHAIADARRFSGLCPCRVEEREVGIKGDASLLKEPGCLRYVARCVIEVVHLFGEIFHDRRDLRDEDDHLRGRFSRLSWQIFCLRVFRKNFSLSFCFL